MNNDTIENQQARNYCFIKSNIDDILSNDFLMKNSIDVIITIENYDYSIIWKLSNDTDIRRYWLTLSNYPEISDWELFQLFLFIEYERKYKRIVGIWCANETIENSIKKYLRKDLYCEVEKPDKLTACTACNHKGCLTEYVMHIASIEDAKSIFKSGKLLSASNIQQFNGDENYIKNRNAAGDPRDYCDYIMFGWGNCQAGDRIVVERKIGHGPSEDELEKHYEPAIRFHFKYSGITKHERATFDGYHPVKIKGELLLSDCLYCCIIPSHLKDDFNEIIHKKIKGRIVYLQYCGENIWDWSEKCYKKLISSNY